VVLSTKRKVRTTQLETGCHQQSPTHITQQQSFVHSLSLRFVRFILSFFPFFSCLFLSLSLVHSLIPFSVRIRVFSFSSLDQPSLHCKLSLYFLFLISYSIASFPLVFSSDLSIYFPFVIYSHFILYYLDFNSNQTLTLSIFLSWGIKPNFFIFYFYLCSM
jgi:hypothetical protein